MVKWEYKELPMVSANDLALFNELGKDGWELVSVLPRLEDWESAKAYFKRPIKNTEGPFIKSAYAFDPSIEKEVLYGKGKTTEKWESDIYTPAGKEVLFRRENKKKKELLFQFRSMVLELLEAGNMIPSEVKKKAYLLIDSCYDDNGELIA